MTTATNNAVPIVNLPFLYINELKISNDATTPHTVLDISAGICRDQTNTYDMNLGDYDGTINGETANSVTLLNAANNGVNGLDTGSLGASLVYFVYVISDPVKGNPTATLLSLASPTTIPLMPFGYSAYRHIGYAVTNSSSQFLLAYTAGNNNTRKFFYDAPISVGSTASEAAYTAINLTKFVPLVNNIPVLLNASITGTAADTLKLQPGNATGDAVTIIAQVTSQATQQQVTVLAQNTTISSVLSPTINYKNSGTDTIAITVGGFEYFI